MRIRFVIFIVVVLALLTVSGISTASDELGDVRVLHAVTGLGEADFYLNDNFAGTLAYGRAADYMLVAPGQANVRVFAHGAASDGTPLFEGSFALESAQQVNVAVTGTADAPIVVSHPINLEPLALGQGRLSIIHLVTGADAVNATVTAADGTATTLAENLAWGEKQAVELPVGTYTLNVEGLLSDVVVNVNYGTMLTVFVVGAADGSVPIEWRAFPSATLVDGPMGYMRFVHAAADAPNIDVYLNGLKVAANLAPNLATVYMALPVGDYDWNAYEAGADMTSAQALLTGALTIAENVSEGAVAMMSGGSLVMGRYTDDRSAVEEHSSGINVFNASSQPVTLRVDQNALIEGIAPGALSERFTMAEGVHYVEVVVSSAVSAALYENFSVSPFTATNLRTLIITDSGNILLSGRPVAAASS